MMASTSASSDGTVTLAELREFASFDSASQRYVRRSLDVAFCRADAVELWSRDIVEAASIRAQTQIYIALSKIRQSVPTDSDLAYLNDFMGPLIAVSAFDLGQGRLGSFSAYRFLYERLIGAPARPWLPAAFCASAALPNLHPVRRRQLLQSISETAATAPGWSSREPSFFPEWVEKVEV
jgi:hypothetical protein